MSAPTDLVNLGHGRGQLRSAPAQSVFRIDAALGRPLDINRAYANWAQQMSYYTAWTAFRANPTAWRRANPGKPDPPLALHPDQSWHCKGMALDTDDRLRTFTDHGWLFVVQSEPWHAQYYPDRDKYYGQPAGGTSKPITEEEDDMALAVFTKPKDAATVYEIKNGRKRGITGAEWEVTKAAYKAAGEPLPYANGTLTAAQLAKIPNA